MICGHGHEQKFKYPYLRDSKIIQMPYPQAKAIDQNPTLCPASPPAGLTLIGALLPQKNLEWEHLFRNFLTWFRRKTLRARKENERKNRTDRNNAIIIHRSLLLDNFTLIDRFHVTSPLSKIQN